MLTVQAIHTAVPGRAQYKVSGLYRSTLLKQLLVRECDFRLAGILK